MAKLLCNNINGVENIQRRAFMMMGTNNPKVKCSEISGIDLSFWNDGESSIENIQLKNCLLPNIKSIIKKLCGNYIISFLF